MLSVNDCFFWNEGNSILKEKKTLWFWFCGHDATRFWHLLEDLMKKHHWKCKALKYFLFKLITLWLPYYVKLVSFISSFSKSRNMLRFNKSNEINFFCMKKHVFKKTIKACQTMTSQLLVEVLLKLKLAFWAEMRSSLQSFWPQNFWVSFNEDRVTCVWHQHLSFL